MVRAVSLVRQLHLLCDQATRAWQLQRSDATDVVTRVRFELTREIPNGLACADVVMQDREG